jgi:UTP:GlnB (protein PII) uridylyltransferase
MDTSGGGVVVCELDSEAAELHDGAWHRLLVTCDDRAGLLADLSEHLRAHGVDIVSAAVATDTDSGLIVDSFAVRCRQGSTARGQTGLGRRQRRARGATAARRGG